MPELRLVITQQQSVRSNELARLKKKEKHFALFASSWFGTFAMLSRATERLVGHENARR